MTTTALSYPGGKSRMASLIVRHMHPHRLYVEPYCGTASVLLAKPRAAYEFINDLDLRVVTFLRVMRDRPDELARALALTPYSRHTYAMDDPDEPGLDDIEVARRVAVRVGQSFAKVGLVAPSKGWRTSIRAGRSMAETWAMMPDKVIAAAERLRGVNIECLPALALIERYGIEKDAVLYVDPPYLGATRSAAMYAHEMETPESHLELAAALANVRAQVLLSGYADPLYDEAYAGWSRIEIPAVANHNGRGNMDNRRTEVLWSNRALTRQEELAYVA